MDVARLDEIEQELQAAINEGTEEAALRILELTNEMEFYLAAVEQSRATPEQLQALEVRSERPLHGAEEVNQKLVALLAGQPWMGREQVDQELSNIARENASVKSKRRKIIAIADRMTAALKPYVACKAECSQCCHMSTVIYEHEAIRLAEVSGRKMKRLPFRMREVVMVDGDKFNGKACPFLVQNKCSVYEDRPLVCRTHHSLRDEASECSMERHEVERIRPPMYDPDILEVPYMELHAAHNPGEPCGNIAEFFPD